MSIFSKVKRADALAQTKPVLTSIAQLDKLLGGGVHRGQVTELFGKSVASLALNRKGQAGSGKTQVALTVALNVVSSSQMRDHVVYVSTEHCFPIKRLYQMIASQESLDSTTDTLTYTALTADTPNYTALTADTPTYTAPLGVSKGGHLGSELSIADNIHVLNIPDAHHQFTLVKYHLAHFLSLHPHTTLIIIDSISGHYRGLEKGGLETGKEVYEMGAGLKRIADEFDCAVLVLNQVADVMQSESGVDVLRGRQESERGQSGFKAALGVGWEASVNTKIRVCRTREGDGVQMRRLDVIYSPNCGEGGLEFYVDASGVRVRE